VSNRVVIGRTLADRKRLQGDVFMIDVFRSSNTIIELLTRGARRVYPVADLGDARCMKQRHPERLLIGERNGIALEDADGDSSPANPPDGVAGRDVILTTSGGTRCIQAARERNLSLFIASFANAHTVAAYITTSGRPATLWAAGRRGEERAEEDERCAGYIHDLIAGREVDREKLVQRLERSEGAERLRRKGKVDDLDYCLRFHWKERIPQMVVNVAEGETEYPWIC
jgi:2-phosphosulfolactate phosphatase